MKPSFAAVYDEHVWDVYGFVGYRVRNRQDTEDLTQQTFEKALRAWDRFDPRKAQPKTWLLAIARNVVIDHQRKAPASPALAIGSGAGEIDEESLPPATVAEPELGLSPELERALAELSDRGREILAMRFGAEMSGPEIAETLDLTVANVQQIMSRSLRQLDTSLTSSREAGLG